MFSAIRTLPTTNLPSWQISFRVQEDFCEKLQCWLDSQVQSYSCFLEEEKAAAPHKHVVPKYFHIHAYCEEEVVISDWETKLALWAASQDAPLPLDLKIEKLAPTDWAAQSYTAFPPLRLAPFIIHGSHVYPQVTPGQKRLVIDAATAFGTGEHPTTAGCLQLLAQLRRRIRPTQKLTVVDVGCGTGILALAAARLWPHARVYGSDCDLPAVNLAKIHASLNHLAPFVHFVAADGVSHRDLPSQAEIVLANILARPLADMAGDLARICRKYLVLSGIMRHQERLVLSAYRQQGLRLEKRVISGVWISFLLRKAA